MSEALTRHARSFSPPATLWIAAVLATLTIVVGWFRMSPASRGTLWAEDSSIFLQGAMGRPPLATMFASYDGYLHLVPRLVADVVVRLPIEQWAVGMAVASLVVTGLVAGAVFLLAGDVTASTPLRAAIALLPVLVPSTAGEVLGNTANLHWFLLWMTPWLLLATPRSRLGLVLQIGAALVIGLTEIQALYFLPLAVWRWRERATRPVSLALALAIGAQGLTTVLFPRLERFGPIATPLDAVHGYLVNGPLALWLGTPARITTAVVVLGWVVGWVALVPTGYGLAVAAFCRDRITRLAMVVLPMASVVIWAVAYVLSHTSMLYVTTPQEGTTFYLLRYSPVPVALLAAGLLLTFAVDAPGRAVTTVARNVVQWAGVAVLVYAAVLGFSNSQSRDAGPLWSEQVAQARLQCTSGAGDTATLLAAPVERFAATVPCTLLVGG